MSKIWPLLAYKLKMFFGPSYRGRFGPLPLIGLMLVFVPTGIAVGFGLGTFAATLDQDLVIMTLGAVLGTGMAFGFVFALGVGVTAHPSELDFLMTAQVRPRQFLLADMMFEFASVFLTGGISMVLAIVGFLVGVGRPLWLALPLLLVGALFMVLVFMIIQTVTVLKITRPAARVKTIALVLLILSILPALAFVNPSLSKTFTELPIPQAAFGALLYDIMFAKPVAGLDVLVVAGYMAAIGGVWLAVSRRYFFYGVHPTLSAGLGQIDMGAKMAQQRRLIGFFGRSTGTIRLNVGVGSELSLMTRLNLVRVWRDGSFLFIGILVALFLFSGVAQNEGSGSTGLSINILQGATWPIAILALNWCYYERANLWIPVVSGKALSTYFKGLMLSLIIIGAGIAAVIIALLLAVGQALRMQDVAFMVGALVGDSVVATMLLTRIRVKPGAFSPGLLVVLFVTFVAGAATGYLASAMASIVSDHNAVTAGLQGVLIAVFAGVVAYVGSAVLARLARGFEFS